MIMSTVSRWFDKQRGFALGVASSGAGLGIVAVAPFAAFLITQFDWRMAYLIMGIIAWLIVIPLSRILKRNLYRIGTLPDAIDSDSIDMGAQKQKMKEDDISLVNFSLFRAFRTKSFWFSVLIWLFYASSLLLILTHLVPYATDEGFFTIEAVTALSITGGGATVGRYLWASCQIG